MKVLSLFDGMSCGQIALNRVGLTNYSYFASEIDRYAMNVTSRNFPRTIHLGDVKKVSQRIFDRLNIKIDLLIGGSPCQGFSFSGKRLNFKDPRSQLFFEFVRILKETSPKYFLLENVLMDKRSEAIISERLGVSPIKINSSLVSAQNRVRLYWTNIPNVSQPEDKGITLNDILDNKDMLNPSASNGRRIHKATILGRRLDLRGKRQDDDKNIPLIQYLEVRASNLSKSNCLTTVDKDNVLTTMPVGRHPDAFGKKYPFRYYTIKECCRLQTVPEDYFEHFSSESAIKKMLGNGWTVDVIAHILGFIPEISLKGG